MVIIAGRRPTGQFTFPSCVLNDGHNTITVVSMACNALHHAQVIVSSVDAAQEQANLQHSPCQLECSIAQGLLLNYVRYLDHFQVGDFEFCSMLVNQSRHDCIQGMAMEDCTSSPELICLQPENESVCL